MSESATSNAGADMIREYCDRALVLNQGFGSMYDNVDEALGVYENL